MSIQGRVSVRRAFSWCNAAFIFLLFATALPTTAVSQDLCGQQIECLPYQSCEVFDQTGEFYCADSCDNFRCEPGTHCELVQVTCLRAPCPPIARCLPDDPDGQCSLPPDSGDCDGAFLRYYFNQASGRCERFVYGGCGGNTNNFETASECRDTCLPEEEICKLPQEVGPCDAAIPRWWYNPASGQCERFIYGGCGGNQNNFSTQADCERRCGEPEPDVCGLPSDPGPCRAAIPRWYYNQESGRCERFIYGGCGGNQNNFETAGECARRCDAPLDTCQLPKVVGPCEAAIPRWWFNPESGNCERFIYGGCQGNANNFESFGECSKECGAPDLCELPQEVGPCQAAIPRYWFNKDTGACERFVYGGCGGNSNNFQTSAECETTCGVDPCDQQKEVGPCLAAIPRWWHNPETNQCERFTYGGCGGNQNNFPSFDECRLQCPPLVCDNPCEPHQVYKIEPSTNQGYCADTCNGFECSEGYECELQDVSCIQSPCPPIAVCVEQQPVCPVGLAGDFNGDGRVDGADYLIWQRSFGSSVSPGTGADGNCDGQVNAADYTIWRDNYGNTAPASALGAQQSYQQSQGRGYRPQRRQRQQQQAIHQLQQRQR